MTGGDDLALIIHESIHDGFCLHNFLAKDGWMVKPMMLTYIYSESLTTHDINITQSALDFALQLYKRLTCAALPSKQFCLSALTYQVLRRNLLIFVFPNWQLSVILVHQHT